MKSRNLYITTSVLAITFAFGTVAFSEPTSVGLTATNSAKVDAKGSVLTVGNQGLGSSTYVSATGASAAVQSTSVGANAPAFAESVLNPVGAVGNITLSATNTASGEITTKSTSRIAFDPSATLANGASASISALGAVTGVSVNSTDIGTYSAPKLASGTAESITMTSTNSAPVLNRNGTISSTGAKPALEGDASSLGISSTGAASSVSFRELNGTNFATNGVGPIDQTVSSTGDVGVDAATINAGRLGVTAVQSAGQSVSVGATGAVASVGTSAIESGGFTAALGKVNQDVEVTNALTISEEANVKTGALTGRASSVSVTASGAVGSVSESYINNTGNAKGTFGDIGQTVKSDGSAAVAVDNTVKTGVLSAGGAAAQISASGASASVGSSAVNSGGVQLAQFGKIDQTVNSSSETVAVGNSLTVAAVGISPSHANSASIGASGASANVSATTIGSTMIDGANTGAVSQNVKNSGPVTNTGSLVTVQGKVDGKAGFAGISASGASAGVSAASIVGGSKTTEFGAVRSLADNTAAVSVDTAKLNVGGSLSGIATSAGISATGASASASSLNVNTGATAQAAGNFTGGVIHRLDDYYVGKGVVNSGNVTVSNSTVTVTGGIAGKASSAQISATGASSSVSATVIGGGVATGANFGLVVQYANNKSGSAISVANSGVVANGLSGVASSAGISATGASASLSTTVIGNTSAVAGANFAGAYQDVINEGTVGVTNSTVTAGAVSGTAASAQISATGASASVGSSVIAGGAIVGGATVSGLISQAAYNTGAVALGGVSVSSDDVSGTAASVGISGTGASANVSVASIANSVPVTGTSFGPINHYVDNFGKIEVGVGQSANVTVAGVSGTAASASISARGASSSIGASEISSSSAMGRTTFGTIAQNATNSGNITIGSGASIVSSGGLEGTASSASIAASGASASFSLASINSAPMANAIVNASLTQTVVNSGNVSNAGKITVGGILGTAASAGISSIGASAGVSFTAINP